ncbi:TonB-dependent siderophore receptor [Pseudoalteromonas rubra]|uniref:TonB-dependent siderophore receptor n=1 Tax=Pseudoalteromonas rubra TaxID=43658 RepID=A0A4Q7E451_9GAMM|nr:TonB-dependent receptor [Pseudoalteromonas rubra]RZM77507.1 TonB-dependent siderophore receptor [Pseudoalteromonas rubra]
MTITIAQGAGQALLFLTCAFTATTQAAEDADIFELSLDELLNVTLSGSAVRDLNLETTPISANPFNLSALNLPFSIDVIERKTMRARGLTTVTGAVENLVGVISGESPAEPSSFAMRGYIRDSVSVVRDGIKLGPASMTMRPHNTFNLQQIEVIKGPATLQFGQGTASGVINMITRKPQLDAPVSSEAFVSQSRFDTREWGVGLNMPVSASTAARVDVNKTQSDGWVAQTQSHSLNATASLLWQPRTDLRWLVSFDYLEDDLPAYWGTPLVPVDAARDPNSDIVTSTDDRVLDLQTRYLNYNVADSRSDSEHLWSRLSVNWQLTEALSLSNTLFHFKADRAWQNAESYVFNPASGQVDRDRFFVFHDHTFYGNKLEMVYHHKIANMPHQLAFGAEFKATDFSRERGFPDGDSVSLFAPVAGQFGPLDKHLSPTDIRQWGIYLNNALSVTPDWRLFGGLRRDHIRLDRDNYDVSGAFLADESFARTFTPLAYQLGTSYQFSESLSAYAHWSTGHDPVGSNIYLVNANENFDFTDIRQYEFGIKTMLSAWQSELTVSWFDIARRNILLLTSHDTVGNSGTHVAHGLELAITSQPTEHFRLGGNIAYTDASYRSFVDPDFGVNASGHTPPNVPEIVANAWFSWDQIMGLPLEIGGGVRHVSDRYGNFQNSVTFARYETVTLFAAYQFEHARLNLNVRNLLNETYAPWADIFYPAQAAIAAPRTVELSLHINY